MNVRLFASLAGGLLATALVAQDAGAQAPVAAPPAAPAKKAADKAADRADRAADKAGDTAKDAAERAGDAPREAARGARPPARETREATRDTAEEARETARDAAGQARDTAKGARRDARDAGRDAREAGREARETARDTRREVREDTRDLENLRAADLGLWFNARGGADGLVIADVAAQGAIAKVGFQEGDRIISVNDQKVTSEAEFMMLLRADDLRNERVKVIVFRGGREQILYIQPVLLYREVVSYDPLWRYGLVIDDRSPDRIIVLRVYPRTPAYYAGLRAGDVVIGLGGRRVAAVADLVNAFTRPEGRVALQINRGNRTREIEIDTEANAAETRTTLRPNLDTETRIDGRGRVEAREGNIDQPGGARTVIEKPKPNQPANRSLDAPEESVTPEKPARRTTGEKPTAPDTPALPSLKPGEAAVPPPSPPAAPAATPKGTKPAKASSGPQAP